MTAVALLPFRTTAPSVLTTFSGLSFSADSAADTQAAAREWVASHLMANSTYLRGRLPIHFLQTQPPSFALDSEYATHIKCHSSFWEGVVRGTEKHRQEIEDYEQWEENWTIEEPETKKYDEYIGKFSEEEFEEEDASVPVLSLDKLKIDGLPEIILTLGDNGQYEGFFREPPSSYNGSVKLSGRVQIEKAGTRRNYDYDLDRGQWPLGKAWANVVVGGAISSSSAGFSSVKRDGTFTTSTWIGYKPYLVRRLAIQVILELKNGKRFRAKVVAELIDLAGFLAIVDPKEKPRPSWQTHLQFLASVRKVFHGNSREPQFVGPFNWLLYRHRDVEPLFKFCTPDEERLRPKPKHCTPAEQAAEKRLRLYKILYDKGEWLEIGHVLTGIEGSPKQEPNKDQQLPRPIRPDLIVTWSGDLGSALQAFIQHFWLATDKYGNPIDKDDPLDLNHYLAKEASRSDLIGDIDGINIGSAYGSSRSLAENLNAYYGKKSLRRYHEFIANSKNEKGVAELSLMPGKKPPKLSRQARQTIAIHTHGYLKYFWVTGALYHGAEPAKRKRVDDIMRLDSKLLPLSAEIQQVVEYFVRFLEDGLALEQRQGVQPELEESDEFVDELDEEQEKPENEFENCSNVQKNRLQAVSNWARNAVTRAAGLVGNAYGRPDRISPRTGQVLIRHFRTTDHDDLLKILLKLRSIQKAFDKGVSFKCETKCDPIRGVIPCGHALSTQWFGGFGDVHICFDGRPKYCDVNRLSAYEQTALIIHEVAHRYTGIDDQAFYDAVRQDYFDKSGTRVRLDAKRAMNNADSYAYFALDL